MGCWREPVFPRGRLKMWEREKKRRGRHQPMADSGFKGWTEKEGLKETWKRQAQSRTTRRRVSLELGKKSPWRGALTRISGGLQGPVC